MSQLRIHVWGLDGWSLCGLRRYSDRVAALLADVTACGPCLLAAEVVRASAILCLEAGTPKQSPLEAARELATGRFTQMFNPEWVTAFAASYTYPGSEDVELVMATAPNGVQG